jgi:hypothetical protein
MGHPSAAKSIAVHVAYASFALRYQKFEEAARALLKALVFGESTRVKELLAQLMSFDQGMAEILKQVYLSQLSIICYYVIVLLCYCIKPYPLCYAICHMPYAIQLCIKPTSTVTTVTTVMTHDT